MRRIKTPLLDYFQIQFLLTYSIFRHLLYHFTLRLSIINSEFFSYAPSQADVTVYKAISKAPDADKYPNAARWYKHIHSHETEFETLPGDKTTDISQYGPEVTAAAVNPAAAPEAEDDDEVDLFGSDDEEEDAEKAALTAKRLEEYRKKKEAKPKTSMWPRHGNISLVLISVL